ncbi:hypothetical protein TSOC_009133 [Tetrabaena socialis]|uniref:BTB domain-containing protein n=1 Tax=Tetrabaena socialis TaxID=47790 RepID=A0A2J7ZWN3_9CHLO|nr:hypothetical protein TSOC_009133 [Tetrabaena socialis]|eukprot:PNH04687.1 hypothetical protein TSOC_009133 [Tetrabaena socialis]
MHVHDVPLTAGRITAVCPRQLPDGSEQVLVFTELGAQPLLGLPGPAQLDQQGEDDEGAAAPPGCCDGVRLGPPLRLALREQLPSGGGQPVQPAPYIWAVGGGDRGGSDGAAAAAPLHAVPGDGCCFLATRDTLLRLGAGDVLEAVAGRAGEPGRVDGVGREARVQSPLVLAADGGGGLWFADGGRDRIRRAVPQPPQPHQPQQSPAATAAAAGTAAAVVNTLPYEVPDWSCVHALAYDHVRQVLYVCTPRAVYRLEPPPSPAGGGSAGGGGGRLALVAGSEEVGGCVDGVGGAALFGSICDAVVDSRRGDLILLDMEGPGKAPALRRVRLAADGGGAAVRTLPAELGGAQRAVRLAVLPGGWLCAYEFGGSRLRLLRLGVTRSRRLPLPPPPPPPPAGGPVAAAGSGGGGGLAELAADWLAMLADPWDTADVVVRAGGAAFRAHSQVLIARSEYFRGQLLAPPQPQPQHQQGPGAGRAWREVRLPGGGAGAEAAADAGAVPHVLRFVYTGEAEGVPASALRAVLRLAERLGLPRLVASAAQQLARVEQVQAQAQAAQAHAQAAQAQAQAQAAQAHAQAAQAQAQAQAAQAHAQTAQAQAQAQAAQAQAHTQAQAAQAQAHPQEPLPPAPPPAAGPLPSLSPQADADDQPSAPPADPSLLPGAQPPLMPPPQQQLPPPPQQQHHHQQYQAPLAYPSYPFMAAQGGGGAPQGYGAPLASSYSPPPAPYGVAPPPAPYASSASMSYGAPPPASYSPPQGAAYPPAAGFFGGAPSYGYAPPPAGYVPPPYGAPPPPPPPPQGAYYPQ